MFQENGCGGEVKRATPSRLSLSYQVTCTLPHQQSLPWTFCPVETRELSGRDMIQRLALDILLQIAILGAKLDYQRRQRAPDSWISVPEFRDIITISDLLATRPSKFLHINGIPP